MKKILLLLLLLNVILPAGSLAQQATAEPLVDLTFTEGKWNPDNWTVVKSARWDHFGGWVQEEDHIRNAVPADASKEELHGRRAPETYSSMLYKETFSGEVTIRATMSFDSRMAPLLVIASELGQDAQGRAEYRDHFEIVIFDQGVNVWRHIYREGRPSWKRAAYARFALEPKTRYLVELSIKRQHIEVRVDGQVFGYLEESLANEFRVGITGCEGINRFYDFQVSK